MEFPMIKKINHVIFKFRYHKIVLDIRNSLVYLHLT